MTSPMTGNHITILIICLSLLVGCSLFSYLLYTLRKRYLGPNRRSIASTTTITSIASWERWPSGPITMSPTGFSFQCIGNEEAMLGREPAPLYKRTTALMDWNVPRTPKFFDVVTAVMEKELPKLPPVAKTASVKVKFEKYNGNSSRSSSSKSTLSKSSSSKSSSSKAARRAEGTTNSWNSQKPWPQTPGTIRNERTETLGKLEGAGLAPLRSPTPFPRLRTSYNSADEVDDTDTQTVEIWFEQPMCESPESVPMDLEDEVSGLDVTIVEDGEYDDLLGAVLGAGNMASGMSGAQEKQGDELHF